MASLPSEALPQTPPAASGGIRKHAGLWSLLFASLTAIVGSGWLFAPLNAAQQAGPASVLSWLIGAVAILLLAFVNAELTTAFPSMGAVITFPKLSHGKLFAAVMSWVVFLGYVTVAPAEVLAIVTYANNYLPGMVHHKSGLLTPEGFIISVIILGLFVWINAMGVRFMLRIGNTIMVWKLVVPVLTVVVLLAVAFHGSNFTSHGFAPMGFQGVVGAVAASGIVFSYLGFRQSIELSGESSNPQRDLPIAIIGSVVIAAILFVGLEVAFIGAVTPASLAEGWAKLSFTGSAGPFAGLAMLAGLSWLAVLLYIDAVVSPAGTGLIYGGGCSRAIYAAGKEGLAFDALAKLNKKGVPAVGLWITWIVGLLFFLPFPSWQKIVTFISSATVLAYGVGPIALMTLRRTLPPEQYPRPFTLRAAGLIAPLAFIVSNLIIYWSGRSTDDFLFGAIGVIFILYVIAQAVAGKLGELGWRYAWWLLPYFVGMWAITHFGPHAIVGGTGDIGFYTGMGLVVILSLVILALAVFAGHDPAEARGILTSRAAQRAGRG